VQRHLVLAGYIDAQDDPRHTSLGRPTAGTRIAGPTRHHDEERLIAATRGIDDGGTVEQPLHVVRRDRSRRHLRTPLQSEPTANDQPKPIGERPPGNPKTRIMTDAPDVAYGTTLKGCPQYVTRAREIATQMIKPTASVAAAADLVENFAR
jgi:hypothetical protein